MPNRTIFLGIIIGILFLGGVVLLSQEKQEQSRESGETAVITYTDQGYAPKVLEVAPGTRVMFKNESTALMWTASNPHPIHTKLPAFDAQRGLPPGQEYSYVFGKTGTWEYHNHLIPVHEGVIVVQ